MITKKSRGQIIFRDHGILSTRSYNNPDLCVKKIWSNFRLLLPIDVYKNLFVDFVMRIKG